MNYQLSDFRTLKDVEAEIHKLSERKFNLYRELDHRNRDGTRPRFASFEEAYLGDERVRTIYKLQEELSALWKIARMKCTGVGFLTARRR